MRSRLLLLAAVIITAIFSGFLGFYFGQKQSSAGLISPVYPGALSYNISPTPPARILPTPLPASGLSKVITDTLSKSSAKYGIFIKNLSSNEVYSQNPNTQFPAASLYKLWILGDAASQIQSGRLSLDETLSGKIADINSNFNISSDSAELTDGYISMVVSDALDQMITISHNYAALLLFERLGISSLNTYLANHDYHSSTVDELPLTTASDIGSFFDQLYHGQLADVSRTNLMLDLLKRQTLNDKLPKYLPVNTLIAHKTGDLNEDSHDAGIVYSPKANYIIVVLSQSDDPESASESISLLSRAVYQYFNP